MPICVVLQAEQATDLYDIVVVTTHGLRSRKHGSLVYYWKLLRRSSFPVPCMPPRLGHCCFLVLPYSPGFSYYYSLDLFLERTFPYSQYAWRSVKVSTLLLCLGSLPCLKVIGLAFLLKRDTGVQHRSRAASRLLCERQRLLIRLLATQPMNGNFDTWVKRTLLSGPLPRLDPMTSTTTMTQNRNGM